jgi:hypothetical protein
MVQRHAVPNPVALLLSLRVEFELFIWTIHKPSYMKMSGVVRSMGATSVRIFPEQLD